MHLFLICILGHDKWLSRAPLFLVSSEYLSGSFPSQKIQRGRVKLNLLKYAFMNGGKDDRFQASSSVSFHTETSANSPGRHLLMIFLDWTFFLSSLTPSFPFFLVSWTSQFASWSSWQFHLHHIFELSVDILCCVTFSACYSIQRDFEVWYYMKRGWPL